jgi:hypothetical protein
MKLNRLLIAVLAVLSFSTAAFAQDPMGDAQPDLTPSSSNFDLMGDRSAKNGMFIELAGAGGFYSINYERFFAKDAAARIGLMYMGISATSGTDSASVSWLAVPIMAEFTGLRSGNHAFEISAGVSINHLSGTASTFDAFSSGSGTLVAATAFLGYRYQNPAGGMLFRAGFTPLYFIGADSGAFLPWAGISFGYGF